MGSFIFIPLDGRERGPLRFASTGWRILGKLLEDGNISFFAAAFQRFFRCHDSVLEPYDARRLAASCYHALGV